MRSCTIQLFETVIANQIIARKVSAIKSRIHDNIFTFSTCLVFHHKANVNGLYVIIDDVSF